MVGIAKNVQVQTDHACAHLVFKDDGTSGVTRIEIRNVVVAANWKVVHLVAVAKSVARRYILNDFPAKERVEIRGRCS